MPRVYHLLAVSSLIAVISAQQNCFPPPNQQSPKECCAVPNIVPSREQFATCMQQFPMPSMPLMPPTPGSPPPGANCFAGCVLEQLGMMSNGAISKDAASSKLVSMVGSSAEWQAVARTAVDTCYGEVTSLGAQKDSSGCSSAAGAFFECLPTTMFKKCPTSAWTASAECQQQKAHLEKGCSIMTLRGPPPLK